MGRWRRRGTGPGGSARRPVGTACKPTPLCTSATPAASVVVLHEWQSSSTGGGPVPGARRSWYVVLMVRPDERQAKSALAPGASRSGWTILGGVSPLSVSAGAPSSRSRVAGEIVPSQAGCQKPKADMESVDGEQACGPQHKVKSAASSDEQSESRAAHVTAKATLRALHPDGAMSFGGVWGVARVQRIVRNRRGPSDRSSSRHRGPYKPKVKAEAGQRESEGIVVPL